MPVMDVTPAETSMTAARADFHTGTDTGVGKTIVRATVARLLRMNGVSVGVMKPVTSVCGRRDGGLFLMDALLLCQAAGIPDIGGCCPVPSARGAFPPRGGPDRWCQDRFFSYQVAFERLTSTYST